MITRGGVRCFVVVGLSLASGLAVAQRSSAGSPSFPVVDTWQSRCYGDTGEMPCPPAGQRFYGQDAQYEGHAPQYRDNGDGTVSDLVTGLTWQKDPGEKVTFRQAKDRASSLRLAGHDDWRLPTIKELYSLILFDGSDPSDCRRGTCRATPFIDSRAFGFRYGDTAAGERSIDSQFVSSTEYVGTTMGGAHTVFGVNFADGRIKGYPSGPRPGRSTGKLFFALYVRGPAGYGVNAFTDNADGTITDRATGLVWMQTDSGEAMSWARALGYCEDGSWAGHHDWRMPNAKELQSLVDYGRSPQTTGSPAIDPRFRVSKITDESGRSDYPFYWSSTTHVGSDGNGRSAVYVAFGEALGYMRGRWMDVHGAGAQRSDPKAGSASSFPTGHGPQGDAVRVDNYVRCVRGGGVRLAVEGQPGASRPSMSFESVGIQGGSPGRMAPPSGPRGPGSGPLGGAPPAEAVNACSGLSEGASCSFTAPAGARISGTCASIRGQRACVPQDGPPRR